MHENIILILADEYTLKAIANKGWATVFLNIGRNGEIEATLDE